MAIGNTGAFKPLDWDSISIPVDSFSNGTISAAPIKYDYSMPGSLVDYTLEHDKDWLMQRGTPDEMEGRFKKEMAVKLAEKMITDGHIVFTKQDMMAENKIRYKAYTWVGNKDFIEQQRKNKR
jgi:hypothetical protein